MIPFESAVEGSLERSRDGRVLVRQTRRRRSRQPRYTTIRDATLSLGLDRLAGPKLAAVNTALHPCRDLPVWRQFGAVVDLGRIHVIKVAEQRRCASERYLATRSDTCL